MLAPFLGSTSNPIPFKTTTSGHILGDARSPKMQSHMNLKIKFRESFRPFAPMVQRTSKPPLSCRVAALALLSLGG
jgi:hypothetical protein